MTASEQRLVKAAIGQLEKARAELHAGAPVAEAKASTRVEYTIALLAVLGLEEES